MVGGKQVLHHFLFEGRFSLYCIVSWRRVGSVSAGGCQRRLGAGRTPGKVGGGGETTAENMARNAEKMCWSCRSFGSSRRMS